MARFRIYPKRGDSFILTFHRFEITKDGDRFALFNDDNVLTNDCYLSFRNIAAIIPEEQNEENMRCFQVHLKNRPNPLPIFATSFEEDDPLAFYAENASSLHDVFGAVDVPSKTPIEGIYIALSEVIAITCVKTASPSSGVSTTS